jgi:hypothetical protein
MHGQGREQQATCLHVGTPALSVTERSPIAEREQLMGLPPASGAMNFAVW